MGVLHPWMKQIDNLESNDVAKKNDRVISSIVCEMYSRLLIGVFKECRMCSFNSLRSIGIFFSQQ